MTDVPSRVRVRLTAATQGGGELGVRAETKVDNKSIFVIAPDENEAIRQLRAKVNDYIERQAFKGEYPKTIEVEL